MGRGWIGVDLDGTLAKFDSLDWALDKIGDPIEPMVTRVQQWLAQGIEVRVFTARVTKNSHMTERELKWVRGLIQTWTKIHIGTELSVTNVKDFDMIQLWDDRAVRVVENFGHPCCGHHLW